MTEKLITCPACNSANLENSVYCCQCGLPMREGLPVRNRKNQWVSIILMSLVLSGLMTFALQFFNSCSSEEPAEKRPGRDAPAALPSTAVPQEESGITGGGASQPDTVPAGDSRLFPPEPLVVGQVAIITQEGNQIAQIPAAVVGGSWIALPARPCIGGSKWLFRADPGTEVAVEGGLWNWGDTVGFWQTAGKKEFPGPSFAAWQPEKAVRLLTFASGETGEEIMLTTARREGVFAYCRLPGPMGPGIFLQGGRVVGWCFGDMTEGAYMWILSSTTGIRHESTVEDFYNDTFAGGREDFFSRALAMGNDTSPQTQLQMFTEGFWYPPKLSYQDTPPHLRPEVLYPYIAQLVDHIMDLELFNDIAMLADEPLLRETGDPRLLIHVTLAIQKTYGTEAAVGFIEGPGAEILQKVETEDPYLEKMHVDLYLAWLRNLLENNELVKGWQIFTRARDRFGDSLEIHLLGVELALAEGDWSEAESLLYQKKYPSSFRDKMMALADRISSIKGKENQIVISFQPGSREIPVTATISALLDHDFLIDTGSSYVTVPYSTVQALGLESQVSERQQEVQTAGGPVYANVVLLPSIELQGWVVNDVRALIIDLPNRPGTGLLGLNFLDRFRMDLQSDNGILILEPQ